MGHHNTPAYASTTEEVALRYKVNVVSGLDDAAVQDRRLHYGPNQLEDGRGTAWYRVLAAQIVNAMALVMIAGMIVSLSTASWLEGGVIAALVLVNAIAGFFQQYAAEKTMGSLRSLASPSATILRDSRHAVVNAEDLVPGDIVDLKTGDVVAADLRLIEASNLEIDESLLTGESVPVLKDALTSLRVDAGVGVGDRSNMAFSSTAVTKGVGRGIVVATGMHTEVGEIASSLTKTVKSTFDQASRVEDSITRLRGFVVASFLAFAVTIGHFLGVNVGTPLQRKISQLAVGLFILAILLAIIVEAANAFSGRREVIIYAVSTGLSMIPASLTVVLTITFAVGTKRMVARNVIVRKLSALEALGGVNDICSDKTGTLTQGRMVVHSVWLPDVGTWSFSNVTDPFSPLDGHLSFSIRPPDAVSNTEEKPTAYSERPPQPSEDFLLCAALCNHAKVFGKATWTDDVYKRVWAASGDPTEIALQVLAHRYHHGRPSLHSQGWGQLNEYPFSSEKKVMSVVVERRLPGQAPRQLVLMKGAVERVLDACVARQHDDTSIHETGITRNAEAMASSGLRVLAVAARDWEGSVESTDREEVESGMTFLGLVGIYDPPRPESRSSVQACRRAGIVVRMLTGDHTSTAVAIAKEVGIVETDDLHRLPRFTAVTAGEFEALSDRQVDELDELPKVIGRCAPATKVKMIEALKRRHRFAAMTGDGVNDTPSLSRAAVGIAMGTGSDVAKSAADIVLTDDNFASIVAAIEEGRRLFDNIQKFVLHLLATNVIQVTVLLLGLVFKDDEGISIFPLSPVEVLWLVVSTVGPTAMGLGMEAATADIMLRPPHDANASVFTTGTSPSRSEADELIVDMVCYGLVGGAISLGSFFLVVKAFSTNDAGTSGRCNVSRDGCETVFRARATCFATVCWLPMLLAWEVVDMRRSFFRMRRRAEKLWFQWAKDVWRNQLLFWSVMSGIVLVVPLIYVPVINDRVFLHAPIDYEVLPAFMDVELVDDAGLFQWAIVVISVVVFVLVVEAWKLAKRAYLRRQHAKRDFDREG